VRLSDLERIPVDDIDLLVLKQAGVVPRAAKAAKVILAGSLTRKLTCAALPPPKGPGTRSRRPVAPLSTPEAGSPS